MVGALSYERDSPVDETPNLKPVVWARLSPRRSVYQVSSDAGVLLPRVQEVDSKARNAIIFNVGLLSFYLRAGLVTSLKDILEQRAGETLSPDPVD